MENVLSNLLSFIKYQKQRVFKTERYLLTKRVKTLLKRNLLTDINEKERNIFLKFLRFHLIEIFNYPFMSKYLFRKVRIFKDVNNGMYYINTEDGHKLYFKRGLTKKDIAYMWNNLCAEQDDMSPHNYSFNNLAIDADTVLADIGSAEGNFSLKFVEKAKKLYLFEAENEWLEALQATFAPWKDKVAIINKYVSHFDDNAHIALDNYFKDKGEKPTILKIDVEGAENEVLSGAENIINQHASDILLCTYHKQDDASRFSDYLSSRNYEVTCSNGFMILYWDYLSSDSGINFRKGLIHAKKNINSNGCL